ncbi:MAG: SDR family NAD(P)-dependent oxidoreductase [Chloroflexota bacterium]
MALPLEGRVALVTGARSGIGHAIAQELARQGADVAINDLTDNPEVEAVVRAIAGLGRKAIAAPGDVSNAQQVTGMVETTVERLGRLDIMVNNAGIEKKTPFLDVAEHDFDRVIAVNLKGTFLCAQAAARAMVRQGHGGKIINISSIHEDLPMPGNSPYCASKGAIRMLTRTLALELAPHQINVIGVGPGAVATPINQDVLASSGLLDRLKAQIPWGRLAAPEEIARVVAFLASSSADYLTGTTVFVDGGLMHQAVGL